MATTHGLRDWLIWTAGFVAFPLSGLAALAVAGPVDGTVSALVAGLVTGTVIGTGQSLASRLRLDPRRWVPATAAGMGLGLALGATAAGFGTTLGDLALMGAITGVPLGALQALALPAPARRAAWAAAMPALWALGWTLTTLVGVDVERGWSVFGAAGAVTVSALSGALLLHLLRPAATPIGDLA